MAALIVLAIGICGYIVLGLGTTDYGPKGDKLMKIGTGMVCGSVLLALIGAFVAALGGS